MKYILLVGDGMGDLPIPALEDKTPLEAASKPVIDRLAVAGEQLLVQTVPDGYVPGSDVANLSLLGYEPEKCYTGRAPLEAASMGVTIGADEVAFRCNLVTLDRRNNDRIVMEDFSAGHISTEEAFELINGIQESCGTSRLCFYPGVSYRHLMVLKGALPPLLTVPPHDYMDKDVTALYQAYTDIDYLKILLEKSSDLLEKHPVNKKRIASGLKPANCIWLWGAGKSPVMDILQDRFGVTGSLISAVDLLKGIGIHSGLQVVNVEGATGYLDTNYEGKAQAALEALRTQDFVLVHVEAPDEAGHQGLIAEKVQAIEDFDRRIVGPIVAEMEKRGEPFRLVVTMDHFTTLKTRTHEDWPVPMVLYDSQGVSQPSGLPYSESNARLAVGKSGLNFSCGKDFFARFIGKKPADA